jgi:cytochrome b involved in lipid metabolism
VYDFTSFLSEHPAGPQAILDVAGKDGTQIFEEIHSMLFLEDFQPVGEIVN